MQKVSKQSLAMIALSILLAISIALTFTFAAVATDRKTATGTITFTGDAALVISGFDGSDNAGTFTIEIDPNGNVNGKTENATSLSDMSIGLASNSAPAYFAVLLSVEGDNIEIGAKEQGFGEYDKKAIYVALQQTAETEEMQLTHDHYLALSSAKKKMAAGSMWGLDEILKFYVDPTRYVWSDKADKVTLTVYAGTTESLSLGGIVYDEQNENGE